MGYRVSYGPSMDTYTTHGGKSGKKKYLIGVCLVFAIAVHLCFPEIIIAVRDILLPGFDEAAAVSVQVLLEELSSGKGMQESFTTFCEEIISRGIS